MVNIIRDPRYSSDSLQHFGVLGMKWGVRRYVNKDGSLTEEGKKNRNIIKKYDKNGNPIVYKKGLFSENPIYKNGKYYKSKDIKSAIIIGASFVSVAALSQVPRILANKLAKEAEKFYKSFSSISAMDLNLDSIENIGDNIKETYSFKY